MFVFQTDSRCHCQYVGVNTMLYNYTIFSFLDSVKKAKRYTYKFKEMAKQTEYSHNLSHACTMIN